MPARPIRCLAALALIARVGVAAAGPVVVEKVVSDVPRQRFFVARVDLTDPRVSVRVVPAGLDPDGPGPWETTLAPVSVVAAAHGFDVAVNCVFFNHVGVDQDLKKYATGDPAAAANTVVADGKVVSRVTGGPMLVFDRQNRGRVIDAAGAVPADVWQGAAGSGRLVTAGRNTAGDDHARYPRTAAGLTADGRTLVLFVADGRRPGWADGLTLAELADEMIKLGCHDAVNFDGGGSSTMVRRCGPRWRVLNTPSDGAQFMLPLSIERPVAYVFGVGVRR